MGRIRPEFTRRFVKRKTGNITSVIAFVYRLLLFKPFTDYCYQSDTQILDFRGFKFKSSKQALSGKPRLL